ncbi:MAG TPA: patatin-like phospholipase family protein [Alphaproteobacteria bacterium]|nr:patatin-like phospholipase family protein [Alphaproteobacteria bacterium]
MRDVRMVLAAAWAVALLAGCANPVREPGVPRELTTKAVPLGMPANIRYWVSIDTQAMLRDGMAAFERERALLRQAGRTAAIPPANFLSISGGGDNGAFGAGLLVGWTAAGTRPEFKIVTGVSTGALTAPFAFLGPEFDDELKAVYTSIKATDIFESRGLLAALTDDAMADTKPLWGLVGRFANDDMLRRIGEEYRKGRFLLIGTTNLDARQPVVWNIGEIAISGHPQATELFRKILVASAAIPGAFPPVMIDVEIDGKQYQEMHVDGGAMAQVFLYPPSLNVQDVSRAAGIERERHAYIIRNARLDPDWASVERNTLSIVGRAITSLIHTQGIGDLYRIYLVTQKDGVEYNLAFIGPDFDVEYKEQFDPTYMRSLFDYGFKLARPGYPWHKAPPGFMAPSGQASR